MKLSLVSAVTILFLIPGAFSWLWHPKDLFAGLFSSPNRVPQFIRDARHPWLEQNMRYVSRLANPKEALCSLDSSMRSGNGNKTIIYPQDFFSYLEIDNNRVGINRPGWKNAVQRLNEILDCPAALHDAKSFKMQTWISNGAYGIGYPEPSTPPTGLPRLFIEALQSMLHLEKLEWSTFGNGDEAFQKEFASVNLSLPSVRDLSFEIWSHFLVDHCSGVERLGTGRSHNYKGWEMDENARLGYLSSTRNAKNLTELRLGGDWKLNYLETLLDASPNITTLGIDGEIQPPYDADFKYSYGTYQAEKGRILTEYARALTQFPRLKKLSLPWSADLHLGFDGGPWCGNAYDGPDGEELHRQVTRQGAEATELAGSIVLDELPHLEELRIGSYRAELQRYENGTTKAVWPWTGQMTKWLYELYPDVKHEL